MADYLSSYIDQKMFLNKLLNQSGNTSQQFFSNKQDTLSKGGGLAHGSGLNKDTSSGLDTQGFEQKQPFVQDAVSSAQEETTTGESVGKSEAKEESKVTEITVSGSSAKGASPVSSSASPASSPAPSPSVAPVGFSSLIDGFGEPFKNSRSRKSIVFVPNEKELPLQGWKSLRNAGLSSKKVGKIAKNGDSIVHTSKAGNDGKMYFLNNNAWGSLKRKKKIVMED
jgi:hypothetical protein